jgi:anti-sigma regulatory factor (Ser/Thr protein kinase)
MPRVDLASLTSWITAAAMQHPAELASCVAERCGVTRATANRALRQLAALGWVEQGGTPRKPRWRPGTLRQVVRSYALAGLQEDLPWSRDFAPYFALPDNVARMVQHAFTELLNNAIDHSEGTSVTVSLRQNATQAQLLVSDDGRGLFDKIRERFAIDDPVLVMLELAKGKLTSAPERHTGRGLYFSARLADIVDLHANANAFQHRDWEGAGWRRSRALARQGTSIYLAIALDTRRTLDAVMRAASLDGEGYGFERTSVPLRLLSAAGCLESRAQAKRVTARLSQFHCAQMDFDGVTDIGHGFADELFRVFAREHPTVDLVPTNMTPRVAAMVQSVRAGQR